MRKTQFICVMIFLISVVCNITAAVNYVEKDWDIEVIITYDNPSLPAVNIICTMTENWREPGHSMKKNSDGVWEYRYVMERSRVTRINIK